MKRYSLAVSHTYGPLCRSYFVEIEATHLDRCNSFMHVIIEKEKTPFTQNTHYLEDATQKWLVNYKGARAGAGGLPPSTSTKRARDEGNTNGAGSPASQDAKRHKQEPVASNNPHIVSQNPTSSSVAPAVSGEPPFGDLRLDG